jgi:hypothetical protein
LGLLVLVLFDTLRQMRASDTLHQRVVEADRPKATARSTRPGRSTGPRTPQGKARSARNAVPIRADPVWRAAVLRLERQLAGSEPVRRDVARMAAEAVVDFDASRADATG